MRMLRQLADAGRVVVVVTHSVSYLDVCDQILLLAPGGKTAFCGPPDQVEAAMGTRTGPTSSPRWAPIPTRPTAASRQRDQQSSPAPVAAESGDLGEPPQTNLLRQFSTIARRQVRLVVSDRGYTIFLAVLPFLMGALSLTVKGPTPASAMPTRWATRRRSRSTSWCC